MASGLFCSALWTHVTDENFHSFLKANDSPLQNPNTSKLPPGTAVGVAQGDCELA